MPVPAIPLDVVRLILEYLPPDVIAARYSQYQSMAPLMLVCKGWTSLVLDVVWREVCLSPFDMHRLVPLLLSRQDLLDRVRVLRIKFDHAQTIYWQRVEESSYTMTDSWDGVTLLLHRATRVTTLDLDATLPYSSLLATAAYASIATTVTALELDLLARDDIHPRDLDSLWTCLSRFPHLTRLTIVDGAERTYADPTIARPKLRVQHFTLHSYEAEDPDPAGTLRMLQQLDPAPLHSLELTHPGIRVEGSMDPLSGLRDLINLKRLAIWTANDEELVDALPRLCDILPRLTRLAELELSSDGPPQIVSPARPAVVVRKKSPTPVRQLLDALPPSIRRCTVNNIYFDDWKPTRWLLDTRHDLQDDTVATVFLRVPAQHKEGGMELKQHRLVRSAAEPSEWRAMVPVAHSLGETHDLL
ncbi:hypothetical protein C6P46_007000 [Rhodotorula mucilaginosa]|uniref:F-box domain-containing protein n=1 Tax=Rhodotorula mucilaginosa TaxID=5537 RepID=A0A9P6VXS6_RHOMI|nr:hypothetical protein C6P46_007000 [Rhodotorula mucilaginosa]